MFVFHLHPFFVCQLGGISEILLPDKEAIIKLGYTKYRWPPQECWIIRCFIFSVGRRLGVGEMVEVEVEGRPLACLNFLGGFGDLVIKWGPQFWFILGGIKLDAKKYGNFQGFSVLLVPLFGVGQYNDSCLVGVGTKEISKELGFLWKQEVQVPRKSLRVFFPIFSPSKHVFFPGIPSQKFPAKKSSPWAQYL